MSVGLVVIVHKESLPRSFWKLGHINDVIVGQDGKTKGATVRVAGKKQRFTPLNCPCAATVYALEISIPTDLRDAPENSQASETPDELEQDKLEDQPIPPLAGCCREGRRETQTVWIRELQDD